MEGVEHLSLACRGNVHFNVEPNVFRLRARWRDKAAGTERRADGNESRPQDSSSVHVYLQGDSAQ
jgi:hypothetical protein